MRKFFILLGIVGILWSADARAFTKEEEKAIAQVEALNKAFAAVAKRVIPSVVVIETMGKMKRVEIPSPFEEWPFGEFWKKFFEFPKPPPGVRRGLGSGVIVEGGDGKKYILTNNHVVRGADKITVVFYDGREEKAKVRGRDAETDLAVLEMKTQDVEGLPFGDSDKLRVGEIVLAVGNPFREYHTLTMGIVSAKGRSGLRLPEGPTYQNFIQTDAAINPGNSGGPLVNIRGEIVGINTAIQTKPTVGGYMGICFAIPSNMAKDVLEEIVQTGRVVRGFLGVRIGDVDRDMADALGLKEKKGAIVTEVIEGGPSEGKLRKGDVILKVDGKEVEDAAHLQRTIAKYEPDTRVELTIWRDGRRHKVRVKLGERPPREDLVEGKPETFKKLGIEAQALTKDLAERLGYEGEEGVVVTSVEPGSPADEKGIRRGDLIQEVGGKKVRSVREYEAALKNIKPGQAVLFLIRRGEHTFYVALRVPQEEK
ncbi:MAG TPA: Do family serine endopeptidase [Candidatus Latescibacteria bacterium]|nr:Do family serine endopeptidase [Candidatus Latescibacterota bacterium]